MILHLKAMVISVDEKGRLEVVVFQRLKERRSEIVRPIVEGKGECIGLRAASNNFAKRSVDGRNECAGDGQNKGGQIEQSARRCWLDHCV